MACSKGTYIRTLCHDIGEALGCGGMLTALRRTETLGFTTADCHTLEELKQAIAIFCNCLKLAALEKLGV